MPLPSSGYPKKCPYVQERKGRVTGGPHLQYMSLNATYSAEIPHTIQGLAMQFLAVCFLNFCSKTKQMEMQV
jgi:hypothetical protein